jgi:hypothetical protein
MRIIRNERHIRVRNLLGRYMPFAGIAVLAAGWLISFRNPESFLSILIALPLGLLFSIIGGFFTERYVGPVAHHDALARALKGLDDSYVLLQYVLPVPQVLLEPGGCTVFVVKVQGGQVIYQDGRWKHRQRGKVFRQFAGQEAVGAPGHEAERQVSKLQRWLSGRLPSVEVPVRAVIVFVHPGVELDAAASPIPAFYGKKVKAWLRGPGKLRSLPDTVYRQLVSTLGVEVESQ